MPCPLRILVACWLCVAPGCKSPEAYRADADREAYAILDEVRSKLADDLMRIERPVDTLREELLDPARQAEAAPRSLTLVDVLEIAGENSREFQTRRETLYLVALDLTLRRWDFSSQGFGGLGAFLSDTGPGEVRGGGDGSLGFSRLFQNGAEALASIGFTFARDLSGGDGWAAFSNLSLSVTQPLLRGFGRDVVREPLTQAERDVLYEARAFERFRRTFSFDVATRYYGVLGQVETLRNEELNYANLKQLRERNQAFAEAGLLSDIQVDQAKQNELNAENRLVDARRALQDRLDDLKFFLGLPVEARIRLDQDELLDLNRFESEIEDLPEEQAIELALAERLDHAVVRDRVIDATRQVNIRANDLLPGLGVGLDARGSSDQNQPFDVDGSNVNWTASLDLDLPLNRLAERNAYRESLIRLDQARRSVEQSRDSVISQLRDDLRALTAARQTFEIQSGAVVLAERRVESARLNLEAGRASTRDLLESQEALVSAQNAQIRSGIDKLLAELALYRDLELLRVGPQGLFVDVTVLDDAPAPTP